MFVIDPHRNDDFVDVRELLNSCEIAAEDDSVDWRQVDITASRLRKRCSPTLVRKLLAQRDAFLRLLRLRAQIDREPWNIYPVIPADNPPPHCQHGITTTLICERCDEDLLHRAR